MDVSNFMLPTQPTQPTLLPPLHRVLNHPPDMPRLGLHVRDGAAVLAPLLQAVGGAGRISSYSGAAAAEAEASSALGGECEESDLAGEVSDNCEFDEEDAQRNGYSKQRVEEIHFAALADKAFSSGLLTGGGGVAASAALAALHKRKRRSGDRGASSISKAAATLARGGGGGCGGGGGGGTSMHAQEGALAQHENKREARREQNRVSAAKSHTKNKEATAAREARIEVLEGEVKARNQTIRAMEDRNVEFRKSMIEACKTGKSPQALAVELEFLLMKRDTSVVAPTVTAATAPSTAASSSGHASVSSSSSEA